MVSPPRQPSGSFLRGGEDTWGSGTQTAPSGHLQSTPATSSLRAAQSHFGEFQQESDLLRGPRQTHRDGRRTLAAGGMEGRRRARHGRRALQGRERSGRGEAAQLRGDTECRRLVKMGDYALCVFYHNFPKSVPDVKEPFWDEQSVRIGGTRAGGQRRLLPCNTSNGFHTACGCFQPAGQGHLPAANFSGAWGLECPPWSASAPGGERSCVKRGLLSRQTGAQG